MNTRFQRIIGKRRKGTLLLEAIIAIGIFGLFLGGIGVALVLGEKTTISAGDYAKASYLAEQALESVRQMQALGIQPNIIIARAEVPLDRPRKEKVAVFCNVQPADIISAPDIASSDYYKTFARIVARPMTWLAAASKPTKSGV